LKIVLALVLAMAWPAPSLAADPFADQSAFAGDLAALYSEMKARHPNLYRLYTPAEWDARYAALQAKIPELDWPHFVVALHRFVAMAGDGHTNLFSKRLVGPGFAERYAVRFAMFSDGLYVVAATPDIRQAIGGRVVAVNGHPILDVERAEAGLTGHDSPLWAAAWIPTLLLYPGNLAGLDLAGTGPEMDLTLAMPDGALITVTVPIEPFDQPGERPTVFDVLGNGQSAPAWQTQDLPLTYTYWPDSKTVYAMFSHVRNGVVESLRQVADKMFAFIAANDVQRLVIDVRRNGGGNNHLLAPLIDGARTSKLNRPGGLYVLIGRQTFSAAQNFVNRMENSTQVLFAGEPTGASPNLVCETETFRLPRTGLAVLISTRRWQDSAPGDHRIWTMPDIPATVSFDDYVNGRDPVIAAVLAFDASRLQPARNLARRWRRPSQQGDWPLPLPID